MIVEKQMNLSQNNNQTIKARPDALGPKLACLIVGQALQNVHY